MVRMANISRRNAFLLAGAVAVVFAIALIVIEAAGAFSAPERTTISMGSDATVGYMVLFGPITALWGLSIHLRCPDATIRRYLLAIAGLIAFWMLIVLIKYCIRDELAISILWYCFYIPMCAIPTLCLACALRAAAVDGTRAGRLTRAMAATMSAALVLLVLTNNNHHLVFQFSFDDPSWQADYHYALGYYLLATWCGALLALFFGTLFLAARRQLRSALVPLGVLVGIGAIYSVLYALRHIITLASNISLLYSVLAIAALELALDLGLLPSYAWYVDAFKDLPFDLKLLNTKDGIEFATAVAKPLQPAAVAMLENPAKGDEDAWTFRTSAIPGILFKTYPVRGGRALLAEDVSSIDERRAALEAKRERLRRSNSLLSQRRKVQRELWRLQSERELFGEIEASLQSKTQRIKEILDALPSADDADAAAKRREMLIEVKLLVAYCKRKGALVLAEKKDPDFNRERLQLVFNETASDLRSIGVDCAAFVQTSAVLPARVVSVLYDCLYDFATAAYAAQDAALMLFVQEEPHAVLLRAAIAASDAQGPQMARMLADLREHLNSRGVEHSIDIDTESITLVARVATANAGASTSASTDEPGRGV